MRHTSIFILLTAALLTSCGHRAANQLHPAQTTAQVIQTQHGIASSYLDHRTASGEPYRASAFAAAHRTWPMGTRARVTHLSTGRHAIVKINDRGPYIRNRIIDLTPAAASAIGLTKRQGIAKVKVERLK